jgi:VanZ family protein
MPPLVYMMLIFHFSSESEPLPVLTAHIWDKLLHLIEYAGLALLVFRALDGEDLSWPRSTALTIIIVSAYGASDELHQLFVPLRTSDLRDWMTDTLAGGIGAAACAAFRFSGNRKKSSS